MDGVERYFLVWWLAFHLRSQFDHQHLRFQTYRRLFGGRCSRPNLCDTAIHNFYGPPFYGNDCARVLRFACLQLLQIHNHTSAVHPFRIHLQATSVADWAREVQLADEHSCQGYCLFRWWVLGISLSGHGSNQHFAFSSDPLQHVWVDHRCILRGYGDFASVLTCCKQNQRQHPLQAHETVWCSPRVPAQRSRRNQTHQSALSRAIFWPVSYEAQIIRNQCFQQVLWYQNSVQCPLLQQRCYS